MKWWAVLLVFLSVSAANMRAGLLDAVHVRAKAEAPLEADHAGYQVILFDTHSDTLLVGVDVIVPESFGKVDTASVVVIGADGQRVGEMPLAPGSPPKKTPSFDFNLRREYLANSIVTLAHMTPDSMDVAVIHIGTFGVRDLKTRNGPPPAPKAPLVLAEQGVFGETRDDFKQTGVVPLEEGKHFGFRLYFRGDGRSLPLQVEWTLPRAPKTWGEPEVVEKLKISQDGRTVSGNRTVATGKLIDEIGWTVADGDPDGEYVARISVGGELLKTFTFHLRREPVPGASDATPRPTP